MLTVKQYSTSRCLRLHRMDGILLFGQKFCELDGGVPALGERSGESADPLPHPIRAPDTRLWRRSAGDAAAAASACEIGYTP